MTNKLTENAQNDGLLMLAAFDCSGTRIVAGIFSDDLRYVQLLHRRTFLFDVSPANTPNVCVVCA